MGSTGRALVQAAAQALLGFHPAPGLVYLVAHQVGALLCGRMVNFGSAVIPTTRPAVEPLHYCVLTDRGGRCLLTKLNRPTHELRHINFPLMAGLRGLGFY